YYNNPLGELENSGWGRCGCIAAPANSHKSSMAYSFHDAIPPGWLHLLLPSAILFIGWVYWRKNGNLRYLINHLFAPARLAGRPQCFDRASGEDRGWRQRQRLPDDHERAYRHAR